MPQAASPVRRSLPLEDATPQNIAPFGGLIGGAAPADQQPSAFYDKIRISYPVDFACEHPVSLTLATLMRRPVEVRFMERHFQHTQTFLPLGGKPFVMVLAEPTDGEVPDIAKARAFRFRGDQGVMLNLGVWHEFPFAIEDHTDLVVVLSSQTGYDLATKDPVTEEAQGPDLDKKNIVARTGELLAVDMTPGAA